jgi:hypothetical protein
MNIKDIIEIIAASSLPIGILAIVWHRAKTGKGLGVRVIQIIGVILIIPGIVILSLEKILDG